MVTILIIHIYLKLKIDVVKQRLCLLTKHYSFYIYSSSEEAIQQANEGNMKPDIFIKTFKFMFECLYQQGAVSSQVWTLLDHETNNIACFRP